MVEKKSRKEKEEGGCRGRGKLQCITFLKRKRKR